MPFLGPNTYVAVFLGHGRQDAGGTDVENLVDEMPGLVPRDGPLAQEHRRVMDDFDDDVPDLAPF